jgi:hypothetical protein
VSTRSNAKATGSISETAMVLVQSHCPSNDSIACHIAEAQLRGPAFPSSAWERVSRISYVCSRRWQRRQRVYSSVTQPSLAVFTFLMYLYSVPRVAL